MVDLFIPISAGKKTLVSQCDYDDLMRFKWTYSGVGNGYAYRQHKEDGKHKKLLLHRYLMDSPKGMEVDHINGDRLDNRRDNLRVVTKQQNCVNSSGNIKSSSKYKGVSFIKKHKKWYVSIKWNGRSMGTPLFDCEDKAALAYNRLAKYFFGDFAKLNVVS